MGGHLGNKPVQGGVSSATQPLLPPGATSQEKSSFSAAEYRRFQAALEQYAQGVGPSTEAVSRGRKVADYMASVFHPLYEAADTAITLAWWLNKLHGVDASACYAMAIPVALTVLLKEGLFVSVREWERLRGKPFSQGEKPKVVAGLLQVLTVMGAIAGGAKFGMSVEIALSTSASDAAHHSSTLADRFIAGLFGAYRGMKERLVSFEVAREVLKRFGYADTVITGFLSGCPVANGNLLIADLRRFIINNQPTIEAAGVHGLAVWKALEILTDNDKILSDLFHNFSGENLGAFLWRFWLVIMAASGEKMAQTFDQTEAAAVMHSEDYRVFLASLIETLKQQGCGAARNQQPSRWQRFKRAVAKSKLGQCCGWVSASVTGTANAAGNVASKAIDVLSIPHIVILSLVLPPQYLYLLLKSAGQAAMAFVAGVNITRDGIPGVSSNTFNDRPWKAPFVQAAFAGVGLFSGLAQFNVREWLASFKFDQEHGTRADDQRRMPCGNPLRAAQAKVTSGCPSCSGGASAWLLDALRKQNDTGKMNKAAVEETVRKFAQDLNPDTQDNQAGVSAEQVSLAACFEHPELVTLMQRFLAAGGKASFPVAFGKMLEAMQESIKHTCAEAQHAESQSVMGLSV